MKSSTRENLVTAVVVLLFATVLFLQPTMVGALKGSYKRDTVHCNGKGMINSDNTCNCYSGYRGANCTLRYCPFGKSWATMPIADHTRNRVNVECSNMGTCNINTGKCACRENFEGRACERMSCATAVVGKTCSSHGRCITEREAGLEFNGDSLVRARLAYDEWDADAVQGCVCDQGYTGYDCSKKLCPFGIDPLSTETARTEVFTLVCQTTHGNFNIQINGHTTEALKDRYGPATLKYILEAIPGLGSVTVETLADASGNAPICGRDYLAYSRITLNSYVGPTSPRMYVSRGGVSNSRQNPWGGTSLGGDSLYMETTYTLTCPVCAGCVGAIYFTYGDSISTELLVADVRVSAASDIGAAIAALADLTAAEWEDLTVSVTAIGDDTQICQPGVSNSFTVSLQSNYGNIPDLTMVGAAIQGAAAVQLTWDSSAFAPAGTMKQCSGQGYCNAVSGRCECTRFYEDNKMQFEMVSSDGSGLPGNRGDCGYYQRTQLGTVSSACTKYTNATQHVYQSGRSLCGDHGVCLSRLSDACTCYKGWSGIRCDIATSCPSGPAWFDEPLSATIAHQAAQCSNMGHCDSSTGRCQCRDGYHGAACQYLDCPRSDTDGRACGGHGWCLNMHKWAEMAGFEYGDEKNRLAEPQTWDAFGFHACMCSAGHPSPYSLSGVSNTRYPTVGPQISLDGYDSETPKLPGWRGYACQDRNCPSGNRIVSPSTLSSADDVFTEHTIECVGDNIDTSTFVLSFYDHDTTIITGDMTADEIKAAIEWPATIGNVTVTFLNMGTTACDTGYVSGDGFVVRFDTELGTLPLLQEVSSSNVILNIFESVAGTLVSLT
jgi:hypothetical protein